LEGIFSKREEKEFLQSYLQLPKENELGANLKKGLNARYSWNCQDSILLLTAILAWLHIISAIGWLGGGIMFALVVAPSVAKLSPPSSGEFFVKVVPKVATFFRIAALSTILFGLLLIYFGVSNGDLGPYSTSSTWGVSITIGFSFGFIAFLNSELVAVPPLQKAVKMIKEMQSSGHHQPPAELPKVLRRASLTANITVSLLIVTLIFMVAAGFY
jgi:uncharacterized membrane protein